MGSTRSALEQKEGLTLPGVQGKPSKPSLKGLPTAKGKSTFLYKVHHRAGQVFGHHGAPSIRDTRARARGSHVGSVD